MRREVRVLVLVGRTWTKRLCVCVCVFSLIGIAGANRLTNSKTSAFAGKKHTTRTQVSESFDKSFPKA